VELFIALLSEQLWLHKINQSRVDLDTYSANKTHL